jgi:hypothetical protein
MVARPRSFGAWIERRAGTGGDLGQVARFLMRDPEWTARWHDRMAIRARMVARRATPEDLARFDAAWEAWTGDRP